MPSPRYEPLPDGYDPETPPTEAGERQRHPQDPRHRPGHRERGPRRWPRARPGWTYASVAAAAGVSVKAVKKAVERGQLDMDDLGSVVDWVAKRRQRRARRRWATG